MYVVISPPVIQLGLSLLAIILFALLPSPATAERFQQSVAIPADQVRGVCSTAFVNKVTVDVTVTNGPGLDGVYVLDMENYTKLTSQFNNHTHNNNSNSNSSTLFDYFVGPSCVANTHRITWCNNGDSSDMAEEAAPTILSKSNRICIALSNANATSAVTVTLRAQLELVHSTNSTNDMAASQKNTASSSYGASSYRLLNVVPIFNLSLFTISLVMSF